MSALVTEEELAEIERAVGSGRSGDLYRRLVAEVRRLQAENAALRARLPPRPEPIGPEEPIANLDLSARATRGLCAGGIETVADLLVRTRTDLLSIRGFGPGCLRDVQDVLARHGLKLAGGDR